MTIWPRSHLTPLWEILHALVPPQPTSKAQAALWRYDKLRPYSYVLASSYLRRRLSEGS